MNTPIPDKDNDISCRWDETEKRYILLSEDWTNRRKPMKISELLKELMDNLTDEQKAMPLHVACTDGGYYEIDGLMVITKSSNSSLPEGQVLLVTLGTDED